MFDAIASGRPGATESGSHPPRLVLRAFAAEPAAQLQQQTVLAHWFLRVSRQHPLLITVDDVDYADQPSLAMLAALAERCRQHAVLLALSAERLTFSALPALEVLTGHCTKLTLRALDRTETETLLVSVFGDVPNTTLLAERIHAAAAGRPRECMALARHLIERGVIAYAAGSWTLPQQLEITDMPARVEEVFTARLSALSPLARRLAQLQSLSTYAVFVHEDFVALALAAGAVQIDAALSELLSHEVLQMSGASYRLHHGSMREALLVGLGDGERLALHGALAELYLQTNRPVAGAVSHLLFSGQADRALDLLLPALEQADEPKKLETRSELSCDQLAQLLERALDACERLQRRPRDRSELTRWLFMFSLVTQDRLHTRTAPALLAQLEHDSGLQAWRALEHVAEPMPRLMQALQRAGEQYAATPEHERVYRVDEAIRHLVYYVAISIAIGARTLNGEMLAALAPLLAPFAPLSPILHAMWQNAIAPYEIATGKLVQAYARWLALYEQLAPLEPADLVGVDLIRNAIAFAVGSIDAQLGRDSVGRWAALLDADPLQQVNAMYLRRTLCLHRGDFESAERFRRKAEVLSVQATVRQMFTNTLIVELAINALVRDLTGVKQVGDRIAPLAARHPGWRPYQFLANVHFHHLRGDLHAAVAECEQALAFMAPDGKVASTYMLPWLSIAAAYLHVLFDLERYQEGKAFAERVLAEPTEATAAAAFHEIGGALALIEAKLGDPAAAAARLEAVIAAQQVYNGPGLVLGASYEARARIAIWAGDHAAVERYGQLAAHEYRHGRTSPLGARYERLLQEARSAGMPALLPQLTSFGSTHVGTTALGGGRATVVNSVTSALKSGDDAGERAAIALRLLCEAHAARGGHLYMMRESGLELSASLGADVPDQRLQP
ncbi:MAG TPA: hypothetical protein VK509_00320, partial [Polyangiales bacterium]|nr:hypothetical protein [Polyangiales bacterium]